MKTKMMIMTFLATFIMFNVGIGQNLIIRYDNVNEENVYILQRPNGKERILRKPKARKDLPIKVEVENFNNYIYDIRTKSYYYGEPIAESSTGNDFLTSSAFMTSMLGNLTGQMMFDNSLSPTGYYVAPPGRETDQISAKERQVRSLIGEIDKLDRAIVVESNNVGDIANTLLRVELTYARLQELKFNPRLTGEQIHAGAEKYIQELFNEQPTLISAVGFSKDIHRGLKKSFDNFQGMNLAYQSMAKDLNSSVEDLIASGSNGDFGFALVMNVAMNRSKTIQSSLDELADLMEEYDDEDIKEKTLKVYFEYESIKNNDFKYEYLTNAEADLMKINLRVYGKDAEGKIDTNNLVKSRIITVPVSGGLKITSSVGFNFSSFFAGMPEYYNIDSVITKSQGDNFIPVVATMIHFYKQTAREVTIGGAFGIGFPLTGERSFHFLVGPTIMFGKSQRVLFNFGVFGGQVDRLSFGYEVNDKLSSALAPVPTRKLYDYGFYGGLSFNISSVRQIGTGG
ncbi:MAG: hypothetical protein IIA45_01340 [Bacteroidetes bacterium]|nr:hypothetical protein [Bacteroidota bacterium]